MLVTGNTGYIRKIIEQAYSRFGTNNHTAIRWEELNSWDLKKSLPTRPDPRPLSAVPSILLALKR